MTDANPSPDASSPNPLQSPLPWDLVAADYSAIIEPQFKAFAVEALRMADVPPGGQVVDVACGPGTLSVVAAERGLHVSALDFSPKMLERLQQRIAATPSLAGIEVHQGDGMALPFADARFDAGFSMFGLMFFPDRAKGFGELHRVIKPGGRAVVSSWVPLDRVRVLGDVFAAMRKALPSLPFRDGKTPLGDPEDFERELREAGFEQVSVREQQHVKRSPNLQAFWDDVSRSSAPLVLLKHKLGEEAFAPVARQIYADLAAKYGDGPVDLEMIALLGVGRRR